MHSFIQKLCTLLSFIFIGSDADLDAEAYFGLNYYKYSCVDKNPLSVYVLHPFWNLCVKITPSFVAPNMLTFIGFMSSVTAFAILGIYDPVFTASIKALDQIGENDLKRVNTSVFVSLFKLPHGVGDDIYTQGKDENIPSQVWFLLAALHFTAYTLDGIDGKQARKLKLSCALGELFDHGCDSMTAIVLPVMQFSIFGFHPIVSCNPILGFLVLIAVTIGFASSHVEKYMTGVLVLPWSYDSAQCVCFLLLLVTGAYGPAFWHTVYEINGFVFIFADVAIVVMVLGGLAGAVFSAYNILTCEADYIQRVEGRGKSFRFVKVKNGLFELFRAISPYLLFYPSVLLFVHFNPQVLVYNFRLFCIVLGMVYSNITCRLIISQMTNRAADAYNVMGILFTTLLGMISFLDYEDIHVALLVMGCYFTLSHVIFGVNVVYSLADFYSIDPFGTSKLPKINAKSSGKMISNGADEEKARLERLASLRKRG